MDSADARDSEIVTARRRYTPPWAARLGLELVVVFVGVYAAFALSQHEARKEANERRHQLEDALVREIRGLTSNTRRVAEQLPPRLVAFDSAARAGQRPQLMAWTEPVRVETHMWQATLQSGAIDLFDIPTIYRISRFYNALGAGFEQINQLRSLSESTLIPNLDRGPDVFYEADGRALRPQYQLYRQGLGRLAELAQSITAQGDSLIAQLDSTAVSSTDSAHDDD